MENFCGILYCFAVNVIGLHKIYNVDYKVEWETVVYNAYSGGARVFAARGKRLCCRPSSQIGSKKLSHPLWSTGWAKL